MRHVMGWRAAVLATTLVLSACQSGPPAPAVAPGTATPTAPLAAPPPVIAEARFADLAGWAGDPVEEALPALRTSCARLTAQSDDRLVGVDGFGGRVGNWRPACQELASAAPTAVRAVLERRFRPWSLRPADNADGLFTGYFEPELRGSRSRTERYRTPLLKRPTDLVAVELADFRADWRGQRIGGRVENGRLVPYHDRARIEGGALAGRGLELLWVDDPIDAFFLHIQGSGRVRLSDGALVRVGYAAQNGHPYVAVGRELVQRGAMTTEQVSMQSIRAWLAANPAEAAAVMNLNPSYVFFREIAGDGPIGSQGAVLTPGRSMAVDPTRVPLGVPVWIDVRDPEAPTGVLRRLMVAQDTGGAIRGPVRGDLFWGSGAAAGERAGRMRAPGRWFLLLPVGVTPRPPTS
jgi:membrane-bound lytic murein transglycosylase A